MRIVVVIAAAASLMLLGGKCGKPKAPKEQAVEAVEQAWWNADLATELDEGVELVVEVDSPLLEETAVVHLTRYGSETEAIVVVQGELFELALDAQGEVVEESPGEP